MSASSIADARAFGGQRQREVHRGGRLADAALARGHGDDVLHVRDQLHAALHGVRDDLRLVTLALTLADAGQRRAARRRPACASARSALLRRIAELDVERDVGRRRSSTLRGGLASRRSPCRCSGPSTVREGRLDVCAAVNGHDGGNLRGNGTCESSTPSAATGHCPRVESWLCATARNAPMPRRILVTSALPYANGAHPPRPPGRVHPDRHLGALPEAARARGALRLRRRHPRHADHAARREGGHHAGGS